MNEKYTIKEIDAAIAEINWKTPFHEEVFGYFRQQLTKGFYVIK